MGRPLSESTSPPRQLLELGAELPDEPEPVPPLEEPLDPEPEDPESLDPEPEPDGPEEPPPDEPPEPFELEYRSEYQPPPLRMNPAPSDTWRLALSLPHEGQSLRGASEMRCSASQAWPHDSQRYS